MNKLRYLKHDTEFHNDPWVRKMVRTHGKAWAWMWWTLLEQIQNVGEGDSLTTDLRDLAAEMMSKPVRLLEFLDILAAEKSEKVQFIYTRTENYLRIRATGFRNFQHNLGIKIGSTAVEDGGNCGIDKIREDKIREEKINKGACAAFVPPTAEEVKAYCIERNNGIDPETFLAHYQTTGWMRGKNKIKDWRACVITWEKRNGGNKPVQIKKEKHIWGSRGLEPEELASGSIGGYFDTKH